MATRERKDINMMIRISATDKSRFREASIRSGKSLSEFMREAARNAAVANT